jgi:catechol-2,3-dioxygenase
MNFKLRHIGIVVEDISKYEMFLNNIGFEVFYDETEGGSDIKNLIEMEVLIKIKKFKNRSNDIIEILKYPNAVMNNKISPNKVGVNHIAMTVTNLDETIKRFQQFGGDLLGKVVEKENVKLCYIFDPEGNIFELVEECPKY